jgi:hypothetical protein
MRSEPRFYAGNCQEIRSHCALCFLAKSAGNRTKSR